MFCMRFMMLHSFAVPPVTFCLQIKYIEKLNKGIRVKVDGLISQLSGANILELFSSLAKCGESRAIYCPHSSSHKSAFSLPQLVFI